MHLRGLNSFDFTSKTSQQCEKHSKKEEALEKLRGGAKFDEVAREFSEDKARQGEKTFFLRFHACVCHCAGPSPFLSEPPSWHFTICCAIQTEHVLSEVFRLSKIFNACLLPV